MSPIDVEKIRADALALLNSSASGSRCITHLSISLEQALGEVVRLRAGLRGALDAIEHGPGPEATEWVARARVLLPPTKETPTDG